MSGIYILTMVIYLAPASHAALTTIVTEYSSAASCKFALDLNRERLQKAEVLLATCTVK